jgi:hypothetical protein
MVVSSTACEARGDQWRPVYAPPPQTHVATEGTPSSVAAHGWSSHTDVFHTERTNMQGPPVYRIADMVPYGCSHPGKGGPVEIISSVPNARLVSISRSGPPPCYMSYPNPTRLVDRRLCLLTRWLTLLLRPCGLTLPCLQTFGPPSAVQAVS